MPETPQVDTSSAGVPSLSDAPPAPAVAGSTHFHAKDFLLVVLGGLLAVAGGIATQFYQARMAREQSGIEVRLRDQERAVEALRDIVTVMNPPLANIALLFDAFVAGESESTVQSLLADYRQSRAAWYRSSGYIKILAWTYFGDAGREEVATFDSTLAYMDNNLATALAFRQRLGQGISWGERDQIDKVFRSSRKELATRRQIVDLTHGMWSLLIRNRQAGSFDPRAILMMAPAEEAELERRLRRRDSLRASIPPTTAVR